MFRKFILLGLGLCLLASCSVKKPLVFSDDLLPQCHCEGKGDFTLVIEAGMGCWSLFYQPLANELKKEYRVCLIDRPGYASDKVSSLAPTANQVAQSIVQVLAKQSIDKHIILVGHSLGGLHVRAFQHLYPEKVDGIVLLDAASSSQFQELPKEFYEILEKQSRDLNKVIEIAQKGYLKYSKKRIPTYGLPQEMLEEYYEVTTTPEYYYSMLLEVKAFEQNLKRVGEIPSLGDLPLLVIASANSIDEEVLPVKNKNYPYLEHNKIWLELQEGLAKQSTNSTFVVSQANHYLMLEDSQFIAQTIKEWISEVAK